jgi:hypothetical protein
MRWSFLKTITIPFACISIERLKSNLEGIIKPICSVYPEMHLAQELVHPAESDTILNKKTLKA